MRAIRSYGTEVLRMMLRQLSPSRPALCIRADVRFSFFAVLVRFHGSLCLSGRQSAAPGDQMLTRIRHNL